MRRVTLDERAAVKRVMDLMAIPGKSGFEHIAVEWIRRQLLAAGAKKEQLSVDSAQKRSPHLNGGGNSGNLVFKMPGTIRAPRRLLMAHIDTVPLCEGSKPVRRGDRVVPADRATALGADDRVGCAVILTAALEIMKRGLPHPPLTFLWTVQEEVGPYGARFCRLGALGRPKLAFNWDSSNPGRMLLGATGSRRMEIEIHGVASHAGCAPEQGVSAAIVFALAVADLRQNGWHGLVMKNGVRGTSNIGVVSGGNATNVVMDRLNVQAEARAHNSKLRARIVTAYCRAFERAARSVKNSQGEHARVRFVAPAKYESFRLRKREPCVREAERAIRAAGLTPSAGISTAGLDANWMTARGVPTVTIGAGMKSAHTIEECLEVRDYLAACQVALHLATASCEERNR